MNTSTTALLLIGYQNDYFGEDGILRGVLESPERTDEVLARTVSLIDAVQGTEISIIATPIIFSEDYSEIRQAGGILAAIKDAGAFRAGSTGADTVPEIQAFGDRIVEVPGKRGLNAFPGTNLGKTLHKGGITDVIVAGAVTSICIDSTSRAAYERGMNVIVLEDCTAARTAAEQDFFCETIFPTYASVQNSADVINGLVGQTA
ncbi:MAG: cysteine hydrolase [Phycisphaerales bacterium]|jgi:nicotinamidase-related amidase|nr:cysteine hydrolase [Phycisphaerales bacterium]